MKRTMFRKIFAAIICVSVLLTSLVSVFPAFAAESDPVVVISGSDFQSDPIDSKYVDSIVAKMGQKYDSIDGLLFAGDYTILSNVTKADSKAGLEVLTNSVLSVFPDLQFEDMVLIQGNHDPYSLVKDGTLAPDGYNDTADYGVFVINEEYYSYKGTDPEPVKEIAAMLKDYLNEKVQAEYTKPIFVVAHVPLHYTVRTYKNGDGMYASYIFDVLNEAGAAGLNIIYMYGHDHANGYDDYLGGDAVYLAKGDTIQVAQASQSTYVAETLNFSYLNAGFTSYYLYGEETTGYGQQTMVAYEITDDDVTLYRYYANASGEATIGDLKKAGTDAYASDSEYDAAAPEIDSRVYASGEKIVLNKDIDTSINVGDEDLHMQVDFLVREKLGYSFYAYGNDLALYDNYDITLKYDYYYLAGAGAKILRKVTEIESGKQYIIVNRATGQVLTNEMTTTTSGKKVLVLNGTPSLETTDMWLLEGSDDTYSLKTTGEKSYALKINNGNVTFTTKSTSTVAYDEEVEAWYIGKLSSNDTSYYYLQTKEDELEYALGGTGSLEEERCLWDIYEAYTLEEEGYVVGTNTVVYDANGTATKVFEFDEVAAYEMMCKITFSLNCYKKGTKVHTLSASTTFANHLFNTIRATRQDKTVYVDMLNYGSAAQAYFAEAKPVSAVASDTEKFGLPNQIEGVDKYQIYATGDDVASADLATADSNTATGDNARIGTALQILSSNRLVFVVDTGSYSASELTFRMKYGDLVSEVAVADLEKGGDYYYYYADEENAIALYDVKEVITAEVLKGNEVVATKTYSVEAFVAESMNNGGKLEDLGNALMKFADSVKKVVTGQSVYDDVPLPDDGTTAPPDTPVEPEIDYVLKEVKEINSQVPYIFVNKATGKVWTTNFDAKNSVFALDGTATVDTTDLWAFVNGGLAIIEDDGSYDGYYRPNGLLADGKNPIAKYTIAEISAAYDEAANAWTIGRVSDDGTYYFCADEAGNTVISSAEITAPTENCYWTIYEFVDPNAVDDDEDSNDDPNTGANFTIAYTTDIHVGNGSAINSVVSFYQDLSKLIEEGVELDTVFVSGDLTQDSYKEQWNTLLDAVNTYSPEGIKSYMTLGNHDARSYDYGSDGRPAEMRWAEIWPRYQSFVTATTGLELEVPYFHVEIKGHNGTKYDLVVLCTETAEKDNAYLSPAQIEWFEETLNEIEFKKGEDHNIIVMCHQPITGTVTSSAGQANIGESNDQIKAIIAEHPQVVYLSGHIHTSYARNNIIDNGEGIYVDGIALYGQAYYRVIEIFDDHIKFRVRGINGTWLDDYETIIVTDEDSYNSPDTPVDPEPEDPDTPDEPDVPGEIGLVEVTEVESGKSYIFVNKGTGTVLTHSTTTTTVEGQTSQSVILLGGEPTVDTETLFKVTENGEYYWIGDETVGFVKPNTLSGELTVANGQAIALEYDLIDGKGWIVYRSGAYGDYVLQAYAGENYTVATGLITDLGAMNDYCYWTIYEVVEGADTPDTPDVPDTPVDPEP